MPPPSSTNSSFDSGGQYAFDATSLDLAQACLRKYYYRMVENLVPKRQSVHLIFGGMYAKSLETFYKLRAAGMTTDDALRHVVRAALIASWDHERDEANNRIPNTGQPVRFEDDKKTRVSLIRTIIWYIEEFSDESKGGPTTYHLQDGTPAVELSFSLEFGPYVYSGHLDRVVEHNGLYWMDQKTTGGNISPYFFDNFTPGNQFSGYTWAGQIILKSPVRAGIVDAAQIGTNFTRFERGIITRTADMLDEWQESALYTIERAREAYATQLWPMNTTACSMYGGCPYRGVCSRAPSVRQNYLAGDYAKTKPWSPIESR